MNSADKRSHVLEHSLCERLVMVTPFSFVAGGPVAGAPSFAILMFPVFILGKYSLYIYFNKLNLTK